MLLEESLEKIWENTDGEMMVMASKRMTELAGQQCKGLAEAKRELAQTETYWLHKVLGKVDQSDESVREFVSLGETCADGLKRAMAQLVMAKEREDALRQTLEVVKECKDCRGCSLLAAQALVNSYAALGTTDGQERREWDGDPACTCGCENVPDGECPKHGDDTGEEG